MAAAHTASVPTAAAQAAPAAGVATTISASVPTAAAASVPAAASVALGEGVCAGCSGSDKYQRGCSQCCDLHGVYLASLFEVRTSRIPNTLHRLIWGCIHCISSLFRGSDQAAVLAGRMAISAACAGRRPPCSREDRRDGVPERSGRRAALAEDTKGSRRLASGLSSAAKAVICRPSHDSVALQRRGPIRRPQIERRRVFAYAKAKLASVGRLVDPRVDASTSSRRAVTRLDS